MSQWRRSRVEIASLLAVPTSFSRRLPATKNSRVGMDCTPYHRLRWGLSSASTLNTSMCAAHVVATSARTVLMTWQGLLQGAQNSTRTGLPRLQDCRLEVSFAHGPEAGFARVHFHDCCFSPPASLCSRHATALWRR